MDAKKLGIDTTKYLMESKQKVKIIDFHKLKLDIQKQCGIPRNDPITIKTMR